MKQKSKLLEKMKSKGAKMLEKGKSEHKKAKIEEVEEES